jgi:TrmH family RNA methyltransferase
MTEPNDPRSLDPRSLDPSSHDARSDDTRRDDNSPLILRSAANPNVKHLVRMRDNRSRRKAGRVIVDGWRETAQAIHAGLVLVGIYRAHNAKENAPQDPWQRQVIESAAVRDKTRWVTAEILEKIGYGQSTRGVAHGVVAEFERPNKPLDGLNLTLQPLVMVLDRIEKPGNVGAIFRSAEAAGVSAIAMCDGGDPFHPNAIRSSSGGVFHVPWASASQAEISQYLIQHSIRPLAARVESSESLYRTDWSGPVAIIVGNEAEGLSDRWRTMGDQPINGVRIPMAGQVDSLNVSVAAALLAFTAVHFRGSNANA